MVESVRENRKESVDPHPRDAPGKALPSGA